MTRWWNGQGEQGSLLALLNEEDKEAFLTAYRDPIGEAYVRRRDGSTLLPFRRLFLVAVK